MVLLMASLPVIISLSFIAIWGIIFGPLTNLINSEFRPYRWMNKIDDLFKHLTQILYG